MNNSSQESNGTDLIYKVQYGLHMYFLPITIFIGYIGNFISILVFVFSKKDLRTSSSTVYIIAVLVADTVSLVTSMFTWLEYLGFMFNHSPVICQCYVYLGYICSFLSVWYIVCITTENYIIICHPTKINQMCTRKRARIVTATLAAVSITSYGWSIFITGVQEKYPYPWPICLVYDKYHNVMMIITYIDSVITLLLPSVAIIVMLGAIVFAILKNLHRKRKRQVNKTDNTHLSMT